MRRALTLSVAAMALLFLPVAARAQDEMVDNPPFKHWSAFKVGTGVIQDEKIHFVKGSDEADRQDGGVHHKTYKYTLLESTPRHVVLQLVITEFGHGQHTELAPIKVTYPAKTGKEFVKSSKEGIEKFKEGTDEVTVLGKKIQCKTVDLTDEDEGDTIHHKIWTSDEVPGGIVRDEKVTLKNNKPVSKSLMTVTAVHTP
jgi:hypothetical protein